MYIIYTMIQIIDNFLDEKLLIEIEKIGRIKIQNVGIKEQTLFKKINRMQ